jgi:hypothetical protein
MNDALRLQARPVSTLDLLWRCLVSIAAGACGVTSADTTGAVDGAGTDAASSADSTGAQNVAPGDGGHEAALSGDSAVPGNTSRDGASQDGASQDAARADTVSSDSGGPDSATQDAGIGDAAGTTIAMEVTFYGWADNSPPGNAIAYPANAGQPTIHNAAGGTGTYADPITFATAPTEFSPGTRLYVPFIEKYVVMEDSCSQCTTDWTNSRKYHIDLWMNSNGTESATALMNCEGSWTRTQTNVEINPPPTRVVTTPPLFDPATNTCRTSP